MTRVKPGRGRSSLEILGGSRSFGAGLKIDGLCVLCFGEEERDFKVVNWVGAMEEQGQKEAAAPIQENEVRVTATGRLYNYINYAASLLLVRVGHFHSCWGWVGGRMLQGWFGCLCRIRVTRSSF